MQALRMFYFDTYQTTIVNHFEQFENIHKQFHKRFKLVETLKYSDIMRDNNASQFLKSIVKNFKDYHNINYNDKIFFNSSFSSKKQPGNDDFLNRDEIPFYPDFFGGKKTVFIDSLPF